MRNPDSRPADDEGSAERTPHGFDARCAAILASLRQGDLDRAEELIRCLLEGAPTLAAGHHLQGLVRRARGRPDEALQSFTTATRLKPDFLDAWLATLDVLVDDLGRTDVARATLEALKPSFPEVPEVWLRSGRIAFDARRYAEAAEDFRKAAELAPDEADPWIRLGDALVRLARFDEAEAAFRRVLALRPHDPAASQKLTLVEAYLGGITAAIDRLREAVARHPGDAHLHGALVFNLEMDPRADEAACQAERRRWADRFAVPAGPKYRHAPPAGTGPDRPLKVAYISTEFRRHSAAYLYGPVLWNHDPATVEVHCYATGDGDDDFTERFRAAAQVWREARGWTPERLAQAIHDDAIDIAVDLSGYTNVTHLLALARRPAPIQASGWGHASGTGLAEVDYFLADGDLVPEAERPLFAETCVDLPCWMTYEGPAVEVEVSPLPALTRGYPTFGSLNRLCKVSDAVVAVWARVLAGVPGSRLYLKDVSLNSAAQRARIVQAFGHHGIGDDRIELAGGSSLADHLAASANFDVMLNPFPLAGGTTTAESLWMGVPAVTLAGTSASGRNAVSILRRVGLDRFVAGDPGAYVAIAGEAVADLDALAGLRRDLRARLQASPIGRTADYARAVEALYRRMWAAWATSTDGSASATARSTTTSANRWSRTTPRGSDRS